MTFKEFMAENGYEVKTTFWDDFSIADRFGVKAIKDTYNRAFKEWKGNVTYVTELAMVLNHKIWQYADVDTEKMNIYDKLWRECDHWCCMNLKGDDLTYYYDTTD